MTQYYRNKMLSWLKTTKSMLPGVVTTGVTMVMGNMACDLDSGVSSIVQAYHRSQTLSPRQVIPVMNIPSQDFPLKTELEAALLEVGITSDDLVFRDQLDFDKINDLKLILVDHNVLSDDDTKFSDKIVEIIDHHVKETENENAIIEMHPPIF